MRARWFSSLTNILLLAFSLCMAELVTNNYSFSEEKVATPKVSCATYDNGFDVLNPLYIFR